MKCTNVNKITIGEDIMKVDMRLIYMQESQRCEVLIKTYKAQLLNTDDEEYREYLAQKIAWESEKLKYCINKIKGE